MDFEFTEEQKMYRSSIREFLEKEIAPVVDERDRKGSFTQEETIGYIKELMPFGVYAGTLPKEYGGMGTDIMTGVIGREEMARVWASLGATIWMAETLVGMIPFVHRSIKERLLPRIQAGELICPSAITEPNAGSNTAAIQTTAVFDGNEYVINGTKIWISVATIAHAINVLTVVTDKNRNPLGVAIILVEKEVSPFTTRELPHIGWRAMPTGEISFVDCHVPRENLLVDPTMGYKMVMSVFEEARATIAVMAAGISQAAIDASIKYARERMQFGKPIGSFQLIQNMIYEMIAETEASRLLGYKAIWLVSKGTRARLESSLAKAYASEAAVRVTSKAIQIHGAMGLSDEYPVERYFRDARMLTIPDGTTQIQTLIVGREALGIKAFA